MQVASRLWELCIQVVIIGSHDVAVDTCRRVISQISVRPEKIHKQASAADEDTANNECRYFPPVGWKIVYL